MADINVDISGIVPSSDGKYYGKYPLGNALAPVISASSGTYGQGNSITLTVSGATAKNSTQLVFAVGDPLENGNDATTLLPDQPVSDAANYAHSTADSFMGSGASFLAQMPTSDGGSEDPVIDVGLQDEIYFSTVAKININTAGLDADGQQLKMQRINADPTGISGEPNFGRTFFWGTDDANITDSFGTMFTGSGPSFQPASRRLWELGLLGKWFRTQMYWKASDVDTANGSLWFMDTDETGGVDYVSGRGDHPTYTDFNDPSQSNPSTDISTWAKVYIPQEKHVTIRTGDSPATNMRRCWLPFFKRDSSQIDCYIDGIYINDSCERVELGNAAAWEDCTKRAVQKQTNRQTGSIAFECYEAQFSASDDVYAFVFNRNGEYSDGYLIRAGA